MDLNRIAVFSRVVEAGSFIGAAASLGLKKSSVSRSVAALEEELGIRLLHRTTRKLSLTDAGRAYHDRARDAPASLDEAWQSASSLVSSSWSARSEGGHGGGGETVASPDRVGSSRG